MNSGKAHAPVLLFAYKRLGTLKRTVSALQNNLLAAESDLFIFSDQGKTPEDRTVVREVREYLHTITGFRIIRVFEAEKNKGLANSIISGVSHVIDQYGKVIVVEDDILTTPNFLSYMNEALDRYENTKKVFSISGYSFNLGEKKPLGYSCDTYFTNRGWPWGWATWRNRWEGIDWQMKDYPQFVNDALARREFAKGGSDLNAMLRKQMTGRLDSWAIRWYYHQFRAKGLTLYPIYSKVYNDGWDEYATHTSGANGRYYPLLDEEHSNAFAFPEQAEIHPYYQKKFNDKLGIRARIISRSQSLLQKILK